MQTVAPEKDNTIKDRLAGRWPYWVPLAVAYVVVCVLALVIVVLESIPAEPETEPTVETTTAPMEPTLPPNPYGASDFTYGENGYLTCTAGEYRLGLDVSSHQEDIDWQQVADAGMEFVFVRIGYRGYSGGVLHYDARAAENLRGAKAAGLEVGAYFYSQALNETEAREEAEYCLEFLEEYELDLPLVYDWECPGDFARTANLDGETVTACARVFCEAVEAAGYETGVYFNRNMGNNLYDLISLQEHIFWFALYAQTLNYPHAVDIWQYTNSGTVPGIDGDVDINLMLEKGASE